MPIYEYTCETCGAPFEVFVRSISKAVEPKCPVCGSTNARKGVSAAAVAGAPAGSGGSSVDCGPSL